ncbi:MAG: hypothetical protein ACI8QQ_000192 [Psychroserpens sp.]
MNCGGNNLTSIDLSTNVTLGTLVCSDNGLTSLDISTNTVLDELYCANNNLTSLDSSTNIALINISCENNNIQSLDVSENINLGALISNDNQLTSLNVANVANVANGGNGGLNFMKAQNNTALPCIQIDGGFTPPKISNWEKDAAASFSSNCASLSVMGFNLNLVSLYPNPTTSELNIEMSHGFKQAIIYSVLGKEVLRVHNKNIDVSSLSNGLFLIKIEDESGNVLTKRFIKE